MAASAKSGDSKGDRTLFKYFNSQKQQQQCSMGSSGATSLHTSLRNMALNDDSKAADQGAAPMAVDRVERPPLRQLRPRPLEVSLSSQPSQELQYTPDYLTPQEQQFVMEYDPSAVQLEDDASRSPAPSPHRAGKRSRPHNYPAGDEECSSQSQSQSRSAGEPSTCSKAPSGRPPIARLREVQPPMPRNPYLERRDDHSHVFQASQPCIPRAGYSRFQWDYLEKGDLGHGNFSRVMRAMHRLTGVEYAIKTNKVPIQTLSARNMWLNEMQALSAVMGHPNIVMLHDAWFEPHPNDKDAEAVYFKLELCNGSLRDVIKRGMASKVMLKEQQLLDILRQLASALKHVHELGMVHMDLKPDNVYMAKDNPNVYKLGDFGLAVLQGGQRAGTSEGDSKYLAPEALKSRDYLSNGLTDRLDMFALGASMYELMTMVELPKNGSLWHDLRAGKLTMVPHVSVKLQGLLKKLMAPDPSHRPSAASVLKMIQSMSSAALQPASSAPLV